MPVMFDTARSLAGGSPLPNDTPRPSRTPARARFDRGHRAAGSSARAGVPRARLPRVHFRLAVHALPIAVLLVDAQGRVRLVNPQAEMDFGYRESELLGKPLGTVLPGTMFGAEKGAPQGPPAMPAAAAQCGTVGRKKDGSVFPATITRSPLRKGHGGGALLSVIDTSDRERIAAEIAAQRNEIAHLSRVTMLGELSGSLAHELNQPLTAILSNAQAAQRHMASGNVDIKEIREILADIVEQDKRAGEVIRRLRALLQKGESKHTVVDMWQIATDVMRLMRCSLINHGVEASLGSEPGLPGVLGDRVQIQQVLMNLLMNACDAMAHLPRAERRIEVLLAERNGEVQVSVRDSGSGIDPSVRERIFEPFYTTKTNGTGLGLAICRTILEAHGGRIWGGNNTPRGATFWVAIPAASPEVRDDPAARLPG